MSAALPRRLPVLSPYALFDAPELASVETLRAVFVVTRAALLAANPELLGDEPTARRTPAAAQVWLADLVLTHADVLADALARYRDAVAYDRTRDTAAEPDARTPF